MLLWPFNKYPGTDYETFNWEWLLKTVKNCKELVDHYIEWVTQEIEKMHTDFTTYVNVTENALNSGSIANGAITKPKIESNFLKEIENVYVTPEMFGAIGGDNDDHAALTAAINDPRPLLLTQKYKSSTSLHIPEYKQIHGIDIYNAGIDFDNGAGVVIDGRWVTLNNFTIEGDGTGTGITFSNDTDAHNDTFENLLVNRFETGLLFNVTNWNNLIKSVRINYCTKAIETTASGFNMTFINVYTNSCDKCFTLYGCRASFTGCNFGIIKPRALELSTNARVVFIECNFECDQKIDIENGEHSIFRLSGYSAIFTNCKFVNIRGTSTITFFATYQSLALAEFNSCRYDAHETNEMVNFFDKTSSNTLVYGAIRFTGGCESIPRPDYYSAQEPNWIDVEKNVPISIYNTSALNTDKMYPGMTFYIQSTKKYAFWNGTNLIDMTDGTSLL